MSSDSQDFVCVFWDAAHGFGIARHPGSRRHRKDGLRFLACNIVTDGIEDICPGARIRARIEGKIEDWCEQLVDVEIYERWQPKSDADFADVMAQDERVKRY